MMRGVFRRIGRVILYGLAGLGGLVTVLGLALFLFTLSVRDRPPEMPDAAALWLTLQEKPAEIREVETPFAESRDLVLRDLVQAIDRAADDMRVKLLVLELVPGNLGFASMQALRRAVLRFRESGKPALFFTADLSSSADAGVDYALASAFDEIWLQPSGVLGLTGIALEAPFFRRALDKAGIAPEFSQRYEYKGGADPFLATGFPAPLRQSLRKLIDDLFAQLVTPVAEGRGIAMERARDLMQNGPHLAEAALAAGLIDRIGYRDEFMARAAAILNLPPEEASAHRVTADHYLAASETPPDDDAIRIGLVQAAGPIMDDSGAASPFGFGASGLEPGRVIEALQTALEDETVAGVIFRIDSPGGAYGPSDALRRQLVRIRAAGKPVVVSMGETAASGGYFIAAEANRVIAEPGSITGSIGVYGGKFATRALWARFGIDWAQISTGGNAGMWSFIDAFNTGQRDGFERMLDFVYRDFTDKVARARNLDPAAMERVARGRVWTGAGAKNVGLVDRLGGMDVATAELRTLLDLADDAPLHFVELPPPRSFWEMLQQVLESDGGPGEFLRLFMQPGPMAFPGDRIPALGRDVAAMLDRPAGVMQMPYFRMVR